MVRTVRPCAPPLPQSLTLAPPLSMFGPGRRLLALSTGPLPKAPGQGSGPCPRPWAWAPGPGPRPSGPGHGPRTLRPTCKIGAWTHFRTHSSLKQNENMTGQSKNVELPVSVSKHWLASRPAQQIMVDEDRNKGKPHTIDHLTAFESYHAANAGAPRHVSGRANKTNVSLRPASTNF